MKKWTIEDSKELYNINGWGTSYFGINEKGDVYVTPCKNKTQIDLREVMTSWLCVMSRPQYCLDSPTFSTIVSRKHGVASKRLPRSTSTRAKTMWSIPSR